MRDVKHTWELAIALKTEVSLRVQSNLPGVDTFFLSAEVVRGVGDNIDILLSFAFPVAYARAGNLAVFTHTAPGKSVREARANGSWLAIVDMIATEIVNARRLVLLSIAAQKQSGVPPEKPKEPKPAIEGNGLFGYVATHARLNADSEFPFVPIVSPLSSVVARRRRITEEKKGPKNAPRENKRKPGVE